MSESITSVGTKMESYYGRPIVKEPVWKPEIPIYFWTGGIAGGCSVIHGLARVTRNDRLAKSALYVGAAAEIVSPVLLISDLGRPERFLNMLRVFKVTSPMSVGSWILSGAGTATGIAAAHRLLGLFPKGVARPAAVAAGVLGMPLSTYTATLISNTAVPIWHDARNELPFVFAGGAAASAGAAVALVTPAEHAGPARRLAVGGVLAEMAAVGVMHKRLGEIGRPYEEKGRPATYSKLARALSLAGAAAVAAGRGRRAATVAGGAAVLAGSLAERWSIFRAGFASAADPAYTVGPQRQKRSGD